MTRTEPTQPAHPGRLAGVLVASVILLGVPFVIISHMVASRSEDAARDEMASVRALPAQAIERIEVLQSDPPTLLKTVLSCEEIARFHAGLIEAVDWQPNHPSFTTCLNVVLYTPDRQFEFDMCFKPPPERTAFIYGSHTFYRARSRALYDWFLANNLIDDRPDTQNP